MTANVDFTPPADPWTLFREWYELAQKHEPNYPDAMMLATVGAGGMPSVRVVLLKDYDAGGLTFYTNRRSRKGVELAPNAKAAVCFHWKSLERQIRIEGVVSQVGDAECDAYFAIRPRGNQIGAWASLQSQPLESRAVLEQRVREFEKQYEGREVPRPPHWGGYRLTPLAMEFWQERLYRLHDRILYRQPAADDGVWADDRIVYRREGGERSWIQERLYP